MKLAITSLAFFFASIPSLATAQSEAEPSPPAPAPAFTLDAHPSAESPSPRLANPDHRYGYLRVAAGVRAGEIQSSGSDLFASSGVLPQLSLDASYALYTRGKLAISAGVGWDVGSRSDGARGLKTRLTMQRLTVPIEARFYLAPWLNVFGKVAPGAGVFHARVEDPSSPRTLEATPWVLAGDVSAGASIRLVGTSDNDNPRRARLWFTPEIGYGMTTSHSLRPQPNRDEKDVLGTDESPSLGSLAVNGAFFRATVALTF